MNLRPNRFPAITQEMAALMASGDDADLLRIIAEERDRNREWAEAALMELHGRHVRVLYAVCLRICSVYLADEGQTENLLYRTLWRVFRCAEKFSREKANCVGCDAVMVSRAVRCWMIRQSRWLAKDIANSTAMSRQGEGGSEEVEQVGIEDEDFTIECSDEVRAALNHLPERDRHILLAFYFFTDADTGRPLQPDENVDAFCARRWGTTKDNVRKIRSRALEAMQEWLAPVASPSAIRR